MEAAAPGYDWIQRFAEKSEWMRQNHRMTDLGDMTGDGLITFQPMFGCDCGAKGVYLGTAIYYDRVFSAVDAAYCPVCRNVKVLREAVPLIRDRPSQFLNAARHRLIRDPSLIREFAEDGECPDCHQPTYVFTSKPGELDDGIRHSWRVCINDCHWPGEYSAVQ